ncbi:hypothetical protein A9R05_32865 (plasmid) [Burkholderia sp. KK1]|nr:hypothetical protein A9R05_32865 [Burkholderia sp. KK1]
MAASKVVQRRLTIKKFRDQLRQNRRLEDFWMAVDAVSRHPVTLLVLGFALTAVVGNQFQSWQQEREKERTRVVAAQEAVQRIRQSVSDYVIRGRLLWVHRDGSDSERDRLITNTDTAFVTAMATVNAETEIVLNAMNLSLAGRGHGYELIDALSHLLFVSHEPIFRLLKQTDAPSLSNAPESRSTALADPITDYLGEVAFCAKMLIAPFQVALQVDADIRERAFMSYLASTTSADWRSVDCPIALIVSQVQKEIRN